MTIEIPRVWWRERFARTVLLFVGSCGLRLDAGRRLWIWIPMVLAIVAAVHVADTTPGAALPVAFVGAAVYYLGNAAIVGTPIRRWLIERLGERRAWRWYEILCGGMFLASSLSLGLAARAWHGSLGLPPAVVVGLAILLTIVGFGTKYWAVWVTGLDAYYFRDLFLRRPGPLVSRGPYALLRNPMYGLGNAHAYVPALLAGSLQGLAFAACCHACLYGFYFAVERPFLVTVWAGSPSE